MSWRVHHCVLVIAPCSILSNNYLAIKKGHPLFTCLSTNPIRGNQGHMESKHNGKKNPVPQFNYDLERMKRCVESETVYMPRSENRQRGDIRKWLLSN